MANLSKGELSCSQNVPCFFSSMTKLAACYASRETVVADRDLFVDKLVGKSIRALGHGTHEHANTLIWSKLFDIVTYFHHGGIPAEGDFPAVYGKIIGDGILHHFEELILRVGGANGQAVEKLYHQARKPFEGSGNTNGRGHLDQNSLGCMDVNLKFASLVYR